MYSHKVFSTQFDNPLRAALAIDTALATTSAVAWVPSLHPDHRAHGDDSESESDSDDDEQGNGWIAKGSSSRAAGGLAVVQILRRGLRYIAPIAGDGERPLLRFRLVDRVADRIPGVQSTRSCRSRSSVSCTRCSSRTSAGQLQRQA